MCIHIFLLNEYVCVNCYGMCRVNIIIYYYVGGYKNLVLGQLFCSISIAAKVIHFAGLAHAGY